jgi:hypothetical protein
MSAPTSVTFGSTNPMLGDEEVVHQLLQTTFSIGAASRSQNNSASCGIRLVAGWRE